MLRVEGIEVFYGASQALFGVDIAVGAGEFVTLMGRNGMGKTTTVHSIMGIAPIRAGRITFDGAPIDGLPSHRIARAGIGLVPEGRQVFPNLSVRENLVATRSNRSGREDGWTVEKIYAMFPELGARRASMGHMLSGGERSLTAMALLFALLDTNPSPICVLDEVDAALDESNVGRFNDALQELSERTQFIIITHNRRTLEMADTIYGVSMGEDSTSTMLSLRISDVPEKT